MTRARDVAFIRKLCGLGLPPQTLAASLLPALRSLVPSHSGAVFWVDERGEMTGLYAERMLPPDAMADYYAKHYQARSAGFTEAFRRRAEAASAVSTHSFTRGEQGTPYFRDVMARLDAYHVLYGILRDGRRAFAQISLYRGREDAPFGRQESATLDSVLRYLAAGFADHPVDTGRAAPSVVVEEYLGITRSDGRVASAPEPWQKLLRLAALTQVSPQHAQRERATIEAYLREVCEPLLVPGRDPAHPHVVSHESPWGRFVLKAFRLADSSQGRRADQVGILIRREEPRALTLVKGTGVSELSPQQREVALLLAQGKSNREIADELGLSFNTASYHVKQVYARLDVNDRNMVAEKLLQIAQTAVAR